MSNENSYYSEDRSGCRENRDCDCNNTAVAASEERGCRPNRNRPECCGRRFNNCTSDPQVRRALAAFARQLSNTNEAINCLDKLFNNLEDKIYEDRCCVSNRIKNILRSIQTEICELDDGVRDIRDDLECLDQAL